MLRLLEQGPPARAASPAPQPEGHAGPQSSPKAYLPTDAASRQPRQGRRPLLGAADGEGGGGRSSGGALPLLGGGGTATDVVEPERPEGSARTLEARVAKRLALASSSPPAPDAPQRGQAEPPAPAGGAGGGGARSVSPRPGLLERRSQAGASKPYYLNPTIYTLNPQPSTLGRACWSADHKLVLLNSTI